MAVYTEPPAVVTGQTMTATNWNSWVRTNFQAVWPFTTAGDLAYASAANQLSRLAVGTANKLLKSTGTAPAWDTVAALLQAAAMVASQASGDLMYANGAASIARLGIGTAGKFLKSTGSAPMWDTVAQLISDLRRKGGSATDWYAQGTTNYTPSSAVIQMGTARIAVSGGNGSVSITFPAAFAYKPVVFISKPYDGANWNDFGFSAITTTGFSIYLQEGGTDTLNVDVTWLAIGP